MTPLQGAKAPPLVHKVFGSHHKAPSLQYAPDEMAIECARNVLRAHHKAPSLRYAPDEKAIACARNVFRAHHRALSLRYAPDESRGKKRYTLRRSAALALHLAKGAVLS